jgi:phosphate butyryltransferase
MKETCFDGLMKRAAEHRGTRLVVALPGNVEILEAVRLAHQQLGVVTTLVGDRAVILAAVQKNGPLPPEILIRHHPDPADAIRSCIDAALCGEADVLMKGSVDTATLMKAVLDESRGLRAGRLLSDVVVTEYRGRLLMMSDGGVNIMPDLPAKADIIRNAVTVAHALGITIPLVAVLSATEHVNPRMPSSVDAAELTQMNKRGQITGCVVDGPLALDNALASEAAAEKGIRSEVAGRADILIVPTIEAGNMLAKGAAYFGGLHLAHVIVGARIPVLIPSRADSRKARGLSIALGSLMAAFQKSQADEGEISSR